MSGVSLRAFLYERQGGACYLQITPQCKARQGVMKRPSRKHGAASQSFDHIFPSNQRQVPRDKVIGLMACMGCNSKRSDAPPSPEHIELAVDLFRKWYMAHQWTARYTPASKHFAKQQSRLASTLHYVERTLDRARKMRELAAATCR